MVGFGGAVPGPVLTVLGGVHGDELEGVTSARRFASTLGQDLAAGTKLAGQVRVLAVSNPPAFAARSRTSPVDGANLARVFPGSPRGTLSERIAHVITTELIQDADLLVDLHSAGLRYQMPVFVGYATDTPTAARSGAAAYAFGAPLVWEHDGGQGEGRTMSAAEAHGVPSIYVEGSGGGGLRWNELEIYHQGLPRLVSWLGLRAPSDDVPSPPDALVIHGGHGDTDAGLPCSQAGFCVTRAGSGDVVRTGQPIADILGDDGVAVETICSPMDGMVMMLRRDAEIAAGDSVAMIGPVPQRSSGRRQ